MLYEVFKEVLDIQDYLNKPPGTVALMCGSNWQNYHSSTGRIIDATLILH